MTWIKLEDSFVDHPKVADAGHLAGWLYVCGLCYCSRHLTDGRIPKTVVPRLTDLAKPMVVARRLVEVGLWLDRGDCYEVHDYDDYQRSAEQVVRERETARRRQQIHRGSNGARLACHGDVTALVTPMSHRESRPCHGEVTLPEVEVETEGCFKTRFSRDQRGCPQAVDNREAA